MCVCRDGGKYDSLKLTSDSLGTLPFESLLATVWQIQSCLCAQRSRDLNRPTASPGRSSSVFLSSFNGIPTADVRDYDWTSDLSIL